MINPDVVRECFEGYLTHDRDAAEALIADDFVFTSPQDDHIDRAAFFEHCFPPQDGSEPKSFSMSFPATATTSS